ncbi:MAG: beta-galactosidase [Candidatus Omnitrophota bacterium]
MRITDRMAGIFGMMMLGLLLHGACSAQEKREPILNKRIVVFYPEGFPETKSPKPLSWYREVLGGFGLEVTTADVKNLSDTGFLTRQKFDTLILPDGEYIPFEAEYSIVRFLAEGGNVVTSAIPYVSVKYDAETKTWMSKTHYRGWFAAFQIRRLETWGEFAWAKRSLDKPVTINSDLPSFLSSRLPPVAGPFNMTFGMSDKLNLYGRGDADVNGENAELAANIIFPLYLLRNGEPSDFIAYRYHNKVINGSTMVIFGKLGTALFDGDTAREMLYVSLKLCETKLPGEQDKSYYERLIRLNGEMSSLEESYIDTDAMLRDAALHSFYQNDDGDWQDYRDQVSSYREKFSEIFKAKRLLDQMLTSDEPDCAKQDAVRKDLLKSITETKKEFQGIQRGCAALLKEIPGSEKPPVRNPLKTLQVEAMLTIPNNLYMFREWHFQNLKKLGVNAYSWQFHPWYCNDSKVLEQMRGVKLDFGFYNWPYMELIPSAGELNPSTGQITETERQVFDYEKSDACLKKLLEPRKGIDVLRIVTHSETGMRYGYWGAQAREEYQEYLKTKYDGIEKLNAHWGTDFKDFKEILLPTKKPVTVSEHCNWEHWRSFREKKYEDFLKFSYNTVKKYAPDMPVSHMVSTGAMSSPLYGVNFYNVTRYLDISGIDGTCVGSSMEWFYLDLTRKPVLTCEWGGLYNPVTDAVDGIQGMRAKLWEEVCGGSLGIPFGNYIWSWGGFSAGNFVDSVGLPTLYGWAGRQVVRDLRKIEHILLDGSRKKPETGILFSQTSRCHDQGWGAGGEGNLSNHTQSVNTYYSHLLQFHRSGRVIPEEMFAEGDDLSHLKLLMAPQAEYLSEAVQRKLIEYVKNGGNLLCEGRTGNLDNFGHPLNLIFEEAGVIPSVAKARSLILNNKEYALADNDGIFVPASPAQAGEVLAVYADKQPAIVSIPLGKGRVIVSGVSFGRHNYAFMDEVLAAVWKNVGLREKYLSSEKTVIFREWVYNGENYLLCTWKAGSTPIEKTTLQIRGNYTVRDYMMGKDLPVSFDGQYTSFSTLFDNGGRIFKVSEQSGKTGQGIVPQASVPAQTALAGGDGEIKSASLPYQGYVYCDIPLDIQGYVFQANVVASGDKVDKGEAYLVVSRGRETQKKRLYPGGEYYFNFRDKSFLVKCEGFRAMQPFVIIAGIEETRGRGKPSACSLRAENNILTLSNGMISVKLDTARGGRITEFGTVADGVNQITGFGPTNAMSEYDMKFPGFFLEQQFQHTTLNDSPGEVRVLLEMTAPVNGVLLKKTLALKAGESALEMQLRNYNFSASRAPAPVAVNFHTELNIGGMADAKDFLIVPDVFRGPCLPLSDDAYYKPKHNWAACVDRGEKLAYINRFSLDEVNNVYVWMDRQFYTFELFGFRKEVGYGESVDLANRIYLMRGATEIDGFSKGIAAGLVMKNKIDQRDPVACTLEIASAHEAVKNVKIAVAMFQNNVKIMDIAAADSVSFEQNIERDFSFDASKLTDGNYEIGVAVQVDGEQEPLSFRKNIVLAGTEIRENLRRYNEFKARLGEVQKKKGETQKKEIFKIFGMIEDFRTALENAGKDDISSRIRKITENLTRLEE